MYDYNNINYRIVKNIDGGVNMSLQVTLDDRAREWLLNKSRIITISSLSVNNCCVPIEEGSIEFKEPVNKTQFIQKQVGELLFYIQRGLNFRNNNVQIKLSGFSLFKTLRIEGLKRLS